MGDQTCLRRFRPSSGAVSRSGLGHFSRLLGACCDAIVGYFLRRAEMKRLSQLDDRALRDIGLVRSQIEAATQGYMMDPSRAGM